jgi:hypothetical protein
MGEITGTTELIAEKLNTINSAKAFIGREFLTWLWYVADTSGTIEVQLAGKRRKEKVDIWIDDRILLQPDHASGHESLLRGGDPSKSLEAAVALGSGKSVKEIKLGVRVPGSGEFTATLSYDQLTPKSLQLPQPSYGNNDDDKAEQGGHLGTRIALTNTFLQIVDHLFLMFLEERTDASWDSNRIRDIAVWIKDKSLGRKGAQLH